MLKTSKVMQKVYVYINRSVSIEHENSKILILISYNIKSIYLYQRHYAKVKLVRQRKTHTV